MIATLWSNSRLPASVSATPPAVPQEYLLAQLSFKATHLTAKRRLSDVQRQRCLAKATQFSHLHEVFELLKVHGRRSIASEFRLSRSPFATSRYRISAWPISPQAYLHWPRCQIREAAFSRRARRGYPAALH